MIYHKKYIDFRRNETRKAFTRVCIIIRRK